MQRSQATSEPGNDRQIEQGLLNELIVVDCLSVDTVKELSTAQALHTSNNTDNTGPNECIDADYVANLRLKLKVKELETKIDELQKQNQQLIDRVNRKDEFLAAFAHDLKSSLTGGLRIFDVLRNVPAHTTHLELIDSLTESHQSMLRMLWNILEAYRAKEPGSLVRLALTDVPELIEDCCRQLATTIAINHVRLELDLPAHSEPILTDRNVLARIVTNLIDNAVKFSPDGSRVNISMKIDAECFTIIVKDNGNGISVQDQSQMFEKFWQNKKDPYSTMGTGLGLYLCKTLVEKLYGEIHCFSSLGTGTEFVVQLPLIAAQSIV